MELRSPASIDEATRWLTAIRPTIDTPANRALQGEASLARTFAAGRRPDLVWAALDGDRPLGAVAGRELGATGLLDVLALPDDPVAAAALLARATAWAATTGEPEASFGAPAAAPLDDPRVRSLLGHLEGAGWRLLVTRQHYEVPASVLAVRSAARSTAPALALERPGADPARIAALLERVVVGSLDAYDRDGIAAHGPAGAAGRLAADLLEADPAECIRLLVEDGRDVGLVSWRRMPSGRGYVLHVGVAAEARGRGLGRAMLAAATDDLLASGAHTLIADTDDGNAPMRAAFAAEGWTASEARIDLHLP